MYDATPFAINGLAAVCAEEGSLYSYINAEGRTVIPASFVQATPFALNDLAAVAVSVTEDDGSTSLRWGYINEDGALVIETKFFSATSFSADLACVRDGQGIHYVNAQGETVFTPAQSCILAHEFCDDGYAVLEYFDGQETCYYIEIVNTAGQVIHTHRVYEAIPLEGY